MKVFTDFLADYRDLKFIFEYGFYWDDMVTQTLYEKGSQIIRELTGILKDNVYSNGPYVCWWECVGGKKRSQRRLIWQNHYRLSQNRWFHFLYGCFGASDVLLKEMVLNCIYRQKSGICGRTDQDCPYNQRICRIEEKKELFRQLADGIRGNKCRDWIGSDIFDRVCQDYHDVVIIEGNKREMLLKGGRYRQKENYYLKKNSWTFDEMRTHGLLKTEADYDNFLQMLSFFTDFTPLSVLGGHFLRKLRGNEIFKRNAVIFVRNLPSDFALEQEYIYRCLYAMVNRRNIRYGECEYRPIRLRYLDCGMSGLEENLYLQAADLQSGEIQLLPLRDGVYVESGSANADSENCNSEECGIEEDLLEFQVEFYYHSQAEYLRERREKEWRGYCVKIESVNGFHYLKSPYDLQLRQWNIEIACYRVPKRDLPGFLLFIQSFGDFARLLNPCGEWESQKVTAGEAARSKNIEEQSLLNVYDSAALIEELWKESKRLPPRKTELEWLLFIFEYYPNMCRLFMEDTWLNAIKSCLIKEIGTIEWFREEQFEFASRTADLFPEKVKKYRRIMEAVRGHQILEYEYDHKIVKIFPYALEYDVTNHLASRKKGAVPIREPIDIMCYSIKAKRNIKIRFAKIKTTCVYEREQVEFSDLDKLYHILAYSVRCAVYKRQEILKTAYKLIESLWKADSRGEDNYNRKIRKRFGKKADFNQEYMELDKLIHSDKGPKGEKLQEAEAFQREVFEYWTLQRYEETEEDFHYQYQAFLLKLFREACQRLWSPRAGSGVKEQLDQVAGEEIWTLISGPDLGGGEEKIPNEIAFYNERLKNSSVSFSLKKGKEDKIDIVYQMFRCFVCAGDRLPNGQIRFTVIYESFYYRKIHMAFMALGDWIEAIEPVKTADIIRKRRENMESRR